MQSKIDTSVVIPLQDLPGLQFTASLNVINVREKHRLNTNTVAKLKAEAEAIVANDASLSNDAKRKAALIERLDGDVAYQSALEAVETSVWDVSVAEAEVSYYRHCFQAAITEAQLSVADRTS